MAITSIYNQPISASSIDVVQISGSVLGTIDGDTIVNLEVTASHAVSASYAVSASHEIVKEISSSHADFADSASIADTALIAAEANYVASAVQTGSVAGNVLTFTKFDGSSFNLAVSQTGSVASASFADFATSASQAENSNNAISASHALTASYAANVPVTSSYAISASHADNADSAISASHAVASDTAISSSLATNAKNAYVQVSAANVDYHVTFNTINAGYKELLQETEAAQFTYNPSNNKLTVGNISATTLSGSLSGNATSATSASHALQADSSSFAIYSSNTYVTGKNLSGSPIAKGTPLYFTGSGTAGNIVGVYPADAANSSRMPAGGIAGEAISAGAEGLVLLDGFINGVNTSLFNSGDQIWVAAGGGYTNVRPTGSSTLIQPIGYVEKVDASNGSGVIQGPGIERAMPNIQQDYAWVGDADGVAQPTAVSTLSVATASLALNVDSAANLNVASITASNATFTSASIGYLESITGSAKIIGDAFIILNNDTPTERYAGLIVIDSGSIGTSASFQFDGQTNDWFYEYTGSDPLNFGVAMFGPEYGTKGSPTYLTNNRLSKGNGGHHLNDSNISDDGSIVSINSNSQVTGSLTVSSGIFGNVTGNLTGTATTASHAIFAQTATSASHAVASDTSISASHAVASDTSISASHAVQADTATSASHALSADSAISASYVAAANVDGTVASATSASHALNADDAISASFAITASYALNAGDIEGTNVTGSTTTLLFDNAIGTVIGSATEFNTATTMSLDQTGQLVGASVVVYHSSSVEPLITGGTIDKKVGSYDVDAINILTFVALSGSGHYLQTIAGADVTGIVTNSTDTYSSTARIAHIVTLTSAEYTPISASADPNTLYIVI